MEVNGVLAYKFPDDDTSDDSSSSSSNNSSSSGSSTVSKKLKVPMCIINPEEVLTPPDYSDSIIDRLKNDLTLTRTNPQGDEFSNRSHSNSDSNKSEGNIQEKETNTQTECDEVNYIENEDIESDDASTLQFFQLGPTATAQDIAAWFRDNNFGDFVHLFDGFNYYDLRRLNRTDFIEMCGTVKGIQIYNAIEMKPVRPMRTVYCALEPTKTNLMVWQPVYLHCLTAIEFHAEIVSRFKLPTRKHSLWMEGPYGINILVDNEVVEYMEDNDLFLIRIVEYPTVEHYKIILKKYL